MTGRRVVQDIPSTEKFLFLYGAYQSAEWQIPYLVTTMSYEQAATYLKLSDEFTNSDDVEWKLDELYQRNIDWARVEGDIVKYLEMQEQPQFFNSLTVALLPMSAGQPSLHGDFDETPNEWQPPPLHQSELTEEHIGPISIGFFDPFDPSSNDLASGVICWNRKQVHAVAIDGQHRLAAIKELVRDGVNPGAANTRVPIILLILNPKLGYRRPASGSLVSVLRQLFIDLNRNAREVNRARQILLDDRDPMSVFVRHLLTESLTDSLASLEDAIPQLPLSLIDWHSEQAKFESGPYVTTVIGLDGMISKLFRDKRTPDLTDYEAFDTQLIQFERMIGDVELASVRTKLREQAEYGSPFTYDSKWITKLADAFASRWNGAFVTLLTKFTPYRNLLERRVATDSLDLTWQTWFRKQDLVGKKLAGREFEDFERYKSHLQSIGVSLVEYRETLEEIEALKRSLAFTVVFQRAYMDAFLEFRKVNASLMEDLSYWCQGDDASRESQEGISLDDIDLSADQESSEDEEDADESAPEGAASEAGAAGLIESASAELFVSLLNEALDVFPELLQLNAHVEDDTGQRVTLWGGSFRAGGKIDYAKGASQRAKDLILLIAILSLMRREGAGIADFEDFWLENLEGSPRIAFRPSAAAIKRMMARSPKGIAIRVLDEQDADDLSDAALQAVVRQKVSGLWNEIFQ